jgi:hypothetical protein
VAEGKPFDWLQFLMLFAINMVIYAAGIVGSYFNHDRDRDLERIVSHKVRLRREFDGIWRRFLRHAAKFDELRGVVAGKIERVRRRTQQRIAEYRDYFHRFSGEGGAAPDFLRNEIGQYMFQPRNLLAEMDPTSVSIDVILQNAHERHVLDVRQGMPPMPPLGFPGGVPLPAPRLLSDGSGSGAAPATIATVVPGPATVAHSDPVVRDVASPKAAE